MGYSGSTEGGGFVGVIAEPGGWMGVRVAFDACSVIVWHTCVMCIVRVVRIAGAWGVVSICGMQCVHGVWHMLYAYMMYAYMVHTAHTLR